MSVPTKGKEDYLGNAGTAARFVATVCTLVQPAPTRTVITGNARMKQRPIGPLVDAFRANGSEIDYLESQGCLPLSIAPAGLKGSRIQLAASVSSQYVSSILLCAPYASEPVTLEPHINPKVSTSQSSPSQVRCQPTLSSPDCPARRKWD